MTATPPIELLQAAPPLVALRDLHKRFTGPDGSRVAAVHGVSLDVRRGEVLGLVGRSGAGKSTLLRLINLLERPDAGSVRFDGVELTALPAAALRRVRRRIGVVFQHFNLLQNLTVADNVAFPLRLDRGTSRQEVDARVAECLQWVGLTDKARSFPAQLSGGQKQRVAIARALAPKPELLLCDEPTSALDAETTRELLATLQRVNEGLGVTLVIVTHQLQVVRSLCREVAVLDQGRLAERFPVAEAGVLRHTVLGQALERLAANQRDAETLESLEAALA
jgi:D-methionine transport system ATP-binding protein